MVGDSCIGGDGEVLSNSAATFIFVANGWGGWGGRRFIQGGRDSGLGVELGLCLGLGV